MKKALAVLLAGAMVVSMAACSSSSSSSTASSSAATSSAASSASGSSSAASKTSSKDTVNIEIAGDPGDISPYGLWNNNGMRIKFQVMQSLFTRDTSNQDVGVLVDTYTWDDDTHMTLTLKEGIKFSDGNALTTADVMYSLEQAASNSIFQIQAKYVDLDNCVVKDDRTMTIALKYATAFFFTTVGQLNICEKAAMEKDPEGQKTNPTGSGPYVVSEYVTGDHITLTANENYWNKDVDGALIKTVKLNIIGESSQRVIALETGSVDFLWDVPSTDLATLSSDKNYTVLTNVGTSTLGLTLNCSTNSILNDVRLREAIHLAIDATAVTQVSYGDLGEACYTLFNSSFTGVTGGAERYNKGVYCQADTDAAKKLVDEYKAEKGVSTVEINMMNNGDTTRSLALQAILSMLTKAGFEAKITDYEAAVYSQLQGDTAGGWDLFISSQGCPSGLICDYLNSLFGRDSQNRTGLQNEDLFSAIDSAIKITDDEAKMTEYCDQAIDIVLNQEYAWVPLTQIKNAWAFTSNLKGVDIWGPASMRYASFYFE